MNKGIEFPKDIKDNPKAEGFNSNRFMLHGAISDINKVYSVSDYCSRTPSEPSMTIDNYFERLK
jgi:hypothetical protein